MPAVLSIDLKAGRGGFTSHNTFNFEKTDEDVTETYLDGLVDTIESKLQNEDVGAAVILRPSTFASNNQTYLHNKLDDIGIVSIQFIRHETAAIIGALELSDIVVRMGDAVAVFYRLEGIIYGDLWTKDGNELHFDKRVLASETGAGLSRVFTAIPNHVLVSSDIPNSDKFFAKMNPKVFNFDANFWLSAGLIKAKIIRREEGYQKFDAKDIGDSVITPIATPNQTGASSVIGITISSDSFAIAKFENQKTKIIKNRSGKETTECVVAAPKNGQPLKMADGHEQGSDVDLLTHSIDLLGIKDPSKISSGEEPFRSLSLGFNEDAPDTKLCYNANGRIINPEKVVLVILDAIKALTDDSDASIVFTLSSEIKDDPAKLQIFNRLARSAGLEASMIVDNNVALCLGGSQSSDKKDNGTFVAINVSETKVDSVLFQFVGGQIETFKEASRDLPPANTNNREFVASVRDHLLVICKAIFDVLKPVNIDRADVDAVLLHYSGPFRETTKEFLARMFTDKPVTELKESPTMTAIGAALYGSIPKSLYLPAANN